ncbi:MAG: hypothetical protein C0401_03485 [Anaerolinea sp.]|nr:hypothetical protein [Anaerolinea sp.]
MQRDRFIGPLFYFSVIALVGVKALTAIIFVSLVLVAGLNNQKQIIAIEPAAPPVMISQPLPNVSIGLTAMPIATPVPATLVPTIAPTITIKATSTSAPAETATETSAPTRTATIAALPTLNPTATTNPVSTPTSQPLSTPLVSGTTHLLSSPLLGISTTELSSIISQKFEAPPAGEDSGHHGVDFAFWKRGNLESILGVPVRSTFTGKVASAFSKARNPYGYMVIVETPLTTIPKNIVDAIKLPTSTIPSNPSNRLTCPIGFADWWSKDSQSLYTLYAHLNNPPLVKLGQNITEGDVIGDVGNSGASSAPHLHVEMRIGPSNASFSSMGHYDSLTTDLERHNYCMWRISGSFQLFDPMELFSLQY